ncbi:MAG: orotidine-5'-phosphate decarboxylase [Bacteroidales bacterium]|nr:orotidine-5'-phosphate decarboxylase [Bacteroidales bacterium]MBN2818919.1 orotidine-5'-phosphate decarboxylase [Bacteroidales bacterium]
MKLQQLIDQIKLKKSFLCVGLDSDIKKIPEHLLKSERPVLEFNKAIVDATAPYTIAYKPNLAFYESRGLEGWKDLEDTLSYIRKNYPEIFLIADAKRGDIGNTSKMYAEAFFGNMNFDSVTVAPYMGEDSVKPFLEFQDKFVILLALTSNAGAQDFQFFSNADSKPLFTQVIEKSKTWGSEQNMMYVVGATKASMMLNIRQLAPEHFLLVPGVGAQGGSLEEVAKYGMNKQCGLIVNASRSIIFAAKDATYAEKAKGEAIALQIQMESLLAEFKVI